MSDFDLHLNQKLEALRREGLYRQMRQSDSPQGRQIELQGKTLLNFASNDYLGLANEPALKEAAIESASRYGAGAGASRLICSLAPHNELDQAIAEFKGTEAALSFSTGYGTAIGTICALLGKDDVILVDKLVHACIVDAARLCGAKLRVFNHNDVEDLQMALEWVDSRESIGNRSRTLIVTESVFSMDGDCAPLKEIVALKEKHGAWLMVDEAHATGIYGTNGRGVAEEQGVAESIEIQMGTLGKALGASGGYIAGSRALIDFLVNRSRSLIFSTAPVPAAVAAAKAGINFVQSVEGKKRRELLWQRIREFGAALTNPRTEFASAIVPIIIGKEQDAVNAAAGLREAGIFVPAIRYPSVARGQARLRVTITAAHEEEDVRRLNAALASLLPGIKQPIEVRA